MEHLVLLLEQYKYLILIPLAVFEGPIVTLIGGFLVTLGLLNIIAVYVIILFGDIVGDSIAYSIGRWGYELLGKFSKYIGITPGKMITAREYFNKRQTRAIVMSKLIHGIGYAGLVVAGSLKVPYWKYLGLCLLVTIPQAVVLLIVGILFGSAYVQIGAYIDKFALIVSIITLVGIFGVILHKLKFKRS